MEPRNRVADDLQRATRDGGLRLAAALRTLRERGLDEAVAVAEDGAAVNTAEGADPLEVVEIAAHGLRGDLEAPGEFDDADATLIEQQSLDELLALHCVHDHIPPRIPTRYNTNQHIRK